MTSTSTGSNSGAKGHLILAMTTLGTATRTFAKRDRDSRDGDPRDVFLDGLELPRGLEREVVVDGDHRYELNGDDSRSLAAVGAFRVISERDLRDPREESSAPATLTFGICATKA